MEKIAEFLKTKVTIIERDKGSYIEKAYGVRTDKLESKIKLFDYLSRYPLFGYKYFSQVNLEKIHNLTINKEHKTIEGKSRHVEYSNLMKYEGDKHTWEHLNLFYIN
jgi:hypothetical protein